MKFTLTFIIYKKEYFIVNLSEKNGTSILFKTIGKDDFTSIIDISFSILKSDFVFIIMPILFNHAWIPFILDF